MSMIGWLSEWVVVEANHGCHSFFNFSHFYYCVWVTFQGILFCFNLDQILYICQLYIYDGNICKFDKYLTNIPGTCLKYSQTWLGRPPRWMAICFLCLNFLGRMNLLMNCKLPSPPQHGHQPLNFATVAKSPRSWMVMIFFILLLKHCNVISLLIGSASTGGHYSFYLLNQPINDTVRALYWQ